ncbi:MAG: hypothetical protein ABR499_17690 [Gemmatimonadaceae bacterium]
MSATVGCRALRSALALAGLQLFVVGVGAADAQNAPRGEQPYVVEYYYQTRWGYADEFIRLFRKNHFPVLRKEMESGRILSVTATAPRFHGTEDRRWDYRVTIVFRNAQVASEPDPNAQAVVRQLFPDQETFRREEQRRFEILVAHWDVPIVTVDLTR